jgi:hypothetical protein
MVGLVRGVTAVAGMAIAAALFGVAAPPARAQVVIGNLTCAARVENPHFSKGAGFGYVIAKVRSSCKAEGVPPTGTFWVIATMFGPGIPEVSVRAYPAVPGLNETLYVPEGPGLNSAAGLYTVTAVGMLFTDGVPPFGLGSDSKTVGVVRPR